MEFGWTVSIECENRSEPPVAQDHIERFLELLAPYGGSVSMTTTHGRYGATLSLRLPEADPGQALRSAVRLFSRLREQAGLPFFQYVWCEVMTFGELDRQLTT